MLSFKEASKHGWQAEQPTSKLASQQPNKPAHQVSPQASRPAHAQHSSHTPQLNNQASQPASRRQTRKQTHTHTHTHTHNHCFGNALSHHDLKTNDPASQHTNRNHVGASQSASQQASEHPTRGRRQCGHGRHHLLQFLRGAQRRVANNAAGAAAAAAAAAVAASAAATGAAAGRQLFAAGRLLHVTCHLLAALCRRPLANCQLLVACYSR